MVQTFPGVEPDKEPLQQTTEYLPRYEPISLHDSDRFYDIQSIYAFENGINTLYIMEFNQQDQFYITSMCQFRWMQIFTDVEKELKAIILGRATFETDFVKYMNKRIIPMFESILSKLCTDNSKIKILCYANELLMLLQKLCFQIWKTYPQIVMSILKKIFNSNDMKFFDSRFNENTYIPAFNAFYGERLYHHVQSQHQGYARIGSTELFNSQIFYPIQGEVLETFRKQQNAYYLSPFLRMQIFYFYKNGGLELLCDGVRNWSFQYLDLLEIMSFFQSYMDRQVYLNFFYSLREPLIHIYERINEEDLKSSSKEQMWRLSNSMERVLQPFYLLNEVKESVALIEMNIYLQCLKCQNLEKRIFGLQQICDKLNTSLDNEKNGVKEEWYMPENLLSFLVGKQVFDEIVGEKAHFEIIKRSFPIIRFLYRHNQIKQEGVLQMMRMGRGKHETWSNMIQKILNELAEILSEQDMDAVLVEIKDMKIDLNVLNFIKAMGKNQQFEKRESKAGRRLLEELEEENISNLNCNGENFIIKVVKVGNCEQNENNQYQVRRPGDRKYQNNNNNQQQYQQQQFQNQQFQEDDVNDTSCEEGEGIRGRIVEFLLNVIHDQHQTEIGKQAFQIVCQLICGQFRSLRHKYLMYSFTKLFENNPPLPIIHYMILIQKIIQSAYPLDQFKSQTELIKWLDITYNFKLSLLGVLGKTKKKHLEQEENEYYDIIDALLKFYQFLYFASETKLQVDHLKIIWKLLVENAMSYKEQDTFFIWIQNMNQNLLSQDALQMVFFDFLIKVDYNSYTLAMFNCLTKLILYFNVQYKILRNDLDSFVLQKSELIGLQIIWRLFFECQKQEIILKAQSFLLQIINFKATTAIYAELKEMYLSKLFVNDMPLKSLDFSIKLLEEVEGLKFNKTEKGEKLIFIIDNKNKAAFHPKRQEMAFFSSLTVLQAKQQISPKLNPIVRPEDFDIMCRGIMLQDSKLLKEYKFDQKVTFLIICKTITDEVAASAAIPLPYGPPPINPNPINTIIDQPSQSDIDEKITNVCEIMNETDRAFIRFVLELKHWNEEQVLQDLFDDKKDQLMVEYHEKSGKTIENQIIKKPLQQQDMQKQDNNYFSIAQKIANNSVYISKLFDILQQDNPIANAKVWQILQLIPRNQEIYDLIDQSFTDGQWDRIIDLKNHHKLLYNLQILRELLECDFIEDEEECQKRVIAREQFLLHGGLSQVFQLLFIPGLEQNILQIALLIYSIYFNAYALAQLQNPDDYNKLINLKETIKQKSEEKLAFSLQLNNTKSPSSHNSNASNTTPTFQKEQVEDKQDEFKILIKSFKNKPFKDCMKCDWKLLLSTLVQMLPQNQERVFSLLLGILYVKPHLLSYLLEIPDIYNLFLQILTKGEQEELRKMMQYTLLLLCELDSQEQQYELSDDCDVQEKRDIRIQFLKQYLPQLQNPTEYEEFYVVMALFLKKLTIHQIRTIVDLPLLYNQLTQFISQRQLVEERFGDNEDKALQGYLILLTALIEIDPQSKLQMSKQLTQEIYNNLFNLHDDYQLHPKYKRRITRKRAFQLLVEACNNCSQNFNILLDPISLNHERFDAQELDYDTGVKGAHGFVGLKNLGATCYINSLLQQLFMNKSFRKGILNGQIMILNNNNNNNDNEPTVFDNIDQTIGLSKKMIDHTLHQLQLVFIQLQESVKQFINPHPFIKTMCGYDAQPINVYVQSDVNEFFNLLTDKLEQDQKHTKQANLIPQILGGILGHEIRSIESDIEFQRETDEPFLTVTIEIKNKKCLDEALDLFVKPDILDGENKYYCEEIKRKVDAQKRCFFKQLPNTFIITLKRFEFDYNTMLKQKVNDYFEFPPEINMFRWTKDHIIKELIVEDYSDYMYQLSGVLVHVGSAESGHYFSYIKSEDKWFEFNDKNVIPFKFESLKDECFGGNHENQGAFDWNTTKSKNAYLLFYEKVVKNDPNVEGSNEQILKSQVINENSSYLKNQLFYSNEYFQFIKEFIGQFQLQIQHDQDINEKLSYSSEMLMFQQIPNSLLDELTRPPLKVIKLFTLFTYETLMKNKDVISYVNSMQIIIQFFDRVNSASFWLLEHFMNNKQMLIDLLFESSYPEVKNYTVKLLTNSIQTVYELEKKYLDVEVLLDGERYPKSALNRFLKFYCEDILNVAKKNLRRSSEYFNIIKFALNLSTKMIQLFYENRYIKPIYSVLTETLSDCRPSNNMQLSKINEKVLEGPCSAIVEVIGKYILGSRTSGMRSSEENCPTYLFKEGEYVELDYFITEGLLRNQDWKLYFVPMIQLNQIVLDVGKHLCWNDLKNSETIMHQLVQMILDYFNSWTHLDPIFFIIQGLLQIEDSAQHQRLQFLLAKFKSGYLVPKGDSILHAIEQQYNNHDKNYSYCLISWMAEIASTIPFVREYFIENKNEFEFLLIKARTYKDHQYQLMYSVNKIVKAINQLQIIFHKDQEQAQEQEISTLQEWNEIPIYAENDEQAIVTNLIEDSKKQYQIDQEDINQNNNENEDQNKNKNKNEIAKAYSNDKQYENSVGNCGSMDVNEDDDSDDDNYRSNTVPFEDNQQDQEQQPQQWI